ncbi:hypothetical protein ACHAXR_007664 [Thalassiosira sp. AJA248-18]
MAQSDENEALNKRLLRIPLSWPELKTIILSPNIDDLSKLARSVEQQKAYRIGRDNIKNEWKSIYDYILCTKFEFEWVWTGDASSEVDSSNSSGGHRDGDNNNNSQRQKRSNPTFQEYLNGQQQSEKEGNSNTPIFNLCLNDFPYYFSPGIQHWVLWKLGGEVTPGEIATAKLDIMGKNRAQGATNGMVSDCTECGRNNLEQIVNDHEVFLHWVNPPHLKSLPGIDHVHILFHGAPGTSQL